MTKQSGAAAEEKEFNLADFELDDCAVLELLDKKGMPMMNKGKPVSVEVYSPGSEQAVAYEAKRNREMLNRAVHQRSKVKEMDMRKEVADKLAAVTRGFINFPVEPIDVYMNPRLQHITEQVARFHDNTANF